MAYSGARTVEVIMRRAHGFAIVVQRRWLGPALNVALKMLPTPNSVHSAAPRSTLGLGVAPNLNLGGVAW